MAELAYSLTTVSKVKTYLGISVSTWDSVLEELVNDCTVWLENEMGGRRIFNDASDATEYHDGGDSTGYGKRSLFLKRFPIASVTSISYRSGTPGTPVWVAYTADDYERIDNEGTLHFLFTLPVGRQNIKVVYKAGYTTIPHDLNLACQKLVAKEFDKRKSQGIKSEGIGGANVTWNEEIDPSIQRVINKYRLFSC